jgi:hypothetical protein
MARGDQIYVFREFLNLQGIYEHHGIDYLHKATQTESTRADSLDSSALI